MEKGEHRRQRRIVKPNREKQELLFLALAVPMEPTMRRKLGILLIRLAARCCDLAAAMLDEEAPQQKFEGNVIPFRPR